MCQQERSTADFKTAPEELETEEKRWNGSGSYLHTYRLANSLWHLPVSPILLRFEEQETSRRRRWKFKVISTTLTYSRTGKRTKKVVNSNYGLKFEWNEKESFFRQFDSGWFFSSIFVDYNRRAWIDKPSDEAVIAAIRKWWRNDLTNKFWEINIQEVASWLMPGVSLS